jgi:Zn-dependent metalloprotease
VSPLPLLVFFAACAPDTGLVPRPLFTTNSPEELADAVRRAAPTLEALAATHGMSSLGDFQARRVWVDDLGTAHVHVRQAVDGVPVFGGEAIVHLDPYGAVNVVTDDLIDGVVVDTAPDVSESEARVLAGGDGTAELVVLRSGETDHLAWAVQREAAPGQAPSRPLVFIDAHDGLEVWRFENLQTGRGPSEWYGTVTFGTTPTDGAYALEDSTRHVGTYTCHHGTDALYYLRDGDDTWPATLQEAIDGQYAAGAALAYFADTFGREGIDGDDGPAYVDSVSGSGGVLSVLVQYGEDYVNAAWTGSYIEIGSGDGASSGPLTTLDIVGHELTHGVTAYTADLTYSGESGALNESMSDCFGAMIERHARGESEDTWTIGEETWTPDVSGDALRYMYDPARDGTSRDDYADRYTGRDDNGGVHDNSGIGNLAFYLLAEGGSHPRRGGTPMKGIGADEAAAVWYRALTTYMTASTDFAGARKGTLAAAADLYGADAAEVAAVADAWALVGVGEAIEAAPSGDGACPDGYETWTGSLSGPGSSAWIPDEGGYSTAASGTHVATLTGPADADFDLALYRLSASSGRWYKAEGAEGSTSTEALTHEGDPGSWRVRVSSVTGGGAYTACLLHP